MCTNLDTLLEQKSEHLTYVALNHKNNHKYQFFEIEIYA